MEMTRERVWSRFGLKLEPEIRLLGFSDVSYAVEEPLELAAAS